ncbi:MAG: KEOPS complex subunit Pcc1 [Haloarculaceae archaeon]
MTSRKSRSSSPHEAVFSLTYPDVESARRVQSAVEPEVGDIQGDRSSTELDREAATLEVVVDAEDLVALRAGLNTWATLVQVAEAASGLEQA